MRAILLGGGLSLLFTLLGTQVAIRVLVAKGYGQLIRDDGPTTHHTKRGTPTMGGLVIIFSVLLAYALAKLITRDLPSWSGILLLFLLGLFVSGFRLRAFARQPLRGGGILAFLFVRRRYKKRRLRHRARLALGLRARGGRLVALFVLSSNPLPEGARLGSGGR